MPDSLQDSSTGELLEERAEECNNMADELENVDLEIELEDADEEVEGDDDDKQQEYDNAVESALDELQNVSYNGN